MRAFFLATAALIAPAIASGQSAAPAAMQPDAAAPKGRLSDAARPTAYRLAFTIDPDKPRFSGHDEIDVAVNTATPKLYLHGHHLNVASVVAVVGRRRISARYTEVDPTGVARLDFASPLPSGSATLIFDYDAPFGDNAAGMYRVKVADRYYAWTQFESTDARAAFPGFDEPGFKTPFTLTVRAKTGDIVVGNSLEAGTANLAGGMVEHRFAPTRPLPTYLVAIHTGPFARTTSAVAVDAQRAAPLPLGVVATQPQKDKMAYVAAETPRIVQLLERYFGQAFPFPKLDQIGSPIMPGAMENAGADTYGDGIIFLTADAPVPQRQDFGMIVGHELSHQWFGDLVTPAWWNDIWLNESFANWMGYRIGNEWRPELNIGVGGLAEGFHAMNTDALEVGRPIHQQIATNNEIDSAFDNITYGKGGHVIAMIAAYLGDERFRDGVRLHLQRHAYGNATSEQFFQSLADGARDPRVLAAMKSFVDQQGVPVIDIAGSGAARTATQSRYAFLGSSPAPEQWTIPFCYRVIGGQRACTLIDRPSVRFAVSGTGPLIPNSEGTGYYRFNLPAADWQALIARSADLKSAEALAVNDSLWAAFRAGKAPAAWLVAAAKAMAANPDSNAAVDGGQRLAGLHARGLIGDDQLPAYRRLIGAIYKPMLDPMGFNPAAGAHLGDTPDRQKLRQALVGLVASEGRDKAVGDALDAAAVKLLAGDQAAVDQAFIGGAFGVYVDRRGQDGAKRLVEAALSSENPALRQNALGAAASTGRRDVAQYLLTLNDPRLRGFDRIVILQTLAFTPGTVEIAGDWILANYDRLLQGGNGVFLISRLPQTLSGQCGVDRAARLEAAIGSKVRAAGAGVLDFERTLESIRHCGALRDAKRAEIAAAIRAG